MQRDYIKLGVKVCTFFIPLGNIYRRFTVLKVVYNQTFDLGQKSDYKVSLNPKKFDYDNSPFEISKFNTNKCTI